MENLLQRLMNFMKIGVTFIHKSWIDLQFYILPHYYLMKIALLFIYLFIYLLIYLGIESYS